MRNPSLLLLIVVFILAPFKLSAAADTVVVRETRIPVLIERQDNELFHLRIEATQSQMLNEVKLDFGKDVNLNEIESVKLYYGGTESVERRGKTYFAPVDYISNNTPGKTLAANTSYSVLKSEVKAPKREVVLKADQKLFPGVNYFWISLQMKPVASILSKVSAEVVEAKIDGQVAPLKIARKADTHYMGIGVRHAGDDGAAAYRIPGLATSNKGTLLGVYDVRYNNSADLQEYVEIGLSRSTDGGQTWEKMRIPMAFGEYDGLPKAQNGVGDPAILVDKKTGTIWIVAAWTHGMGNGRAWWNSQTRLCHIDVLALRLIRNCRRLRLIIPCDDAAKRFRNEACRNHCPVSDDLRRHIQRVRHIVDVSCCIIDLDDHDCVIQRTSRRSSVIVPRDLRAQILKNRPHGHKRAAAHQLRRHIGLHQLCVDIQLDCVDRQAEQ